jgi:cell division protein FtsN
MKYALTLIAGYYLPNIAQHISLDVCLGVLAGVLLGLLLAMLFVGPTPKPKVLTQKVNKTVRKPRPQSKSIIAKATDYQLFPVSVANMPAIAY